MNRIKGITGLIRLLGISGVIVGIVSTVQAQPVALAEWMPDDAAQPVLTAGAIRALALYGPKADAAFLLAVDDARSGSPIDTLHMSLLERVFWSRHGLLRVTGVFRTDPDQPVNDLRRLAHVRRRMLSLHQILGLTTVASMTATVIAGQRALDGHGGGFHKATIPITVGLYATTATLALASPPKLVDLDGGMDSITFHKAFAVLHLAGMIITPMLAPEADEGNRSRRHVHQAFGYATYGAFTAGMLTVILFK